MPEIKLSQGTVHYRDEGTGAPVVLVHGLLVNGSVWDRLLPVLCPHMRCIVPDLPLGSHRQAMNPDADLSPPGLARLLDELMARLELSDVTLVGNDTGGALCQLLVAAQPARVGRLVLVNCDAFEQFPPPAFRPLVKGLAYLPGAVAGLATMGRLRRARQASMSLAPLTLEPVPDELLRGWVDPLRDRGVRRDLIKVLRGINPEHTLAAVEGLRAFSGPVLIAWGMRDPFFKLGLAERLAEVFADARLEKIEDARTFVQMDAPERLGELMREAAAQGATR